MNSNTNIVEAIAHQIVIHLKDAAGTAQSNAEIASLSSLETQLRELLRQVGAATVAEFLSTSPEPPVPELACGCGGQVRYQRQRSAVVLSVFGRVTYQRAYYAGCRCGQGQAPCDQHYGIQPGQVSAGLAKLLSLAGVELAFEHSARWLQAFLLFEISENTIRQETELMGRLQSDYETELRQQSQSESFLQTRLRSPQPVPTRLYGSIDAGKVRVEARKDPEKQAQTEKWRDLKLGSWYHVEAVPPAQRTARHRAKLEREQVAYRAKAMRYYGDITEAQPFGELLWATGLAAQADRVPELVFVCDGASWIWNLIDHYYPQAVQIVDWYHAADRLTRIAQAAFSEPAAQTAWRDQVTEDLWQGCVRDVVRACQALDGCAEAQAAVTYFTNHAERMRYPHFRAAGYMIGSGTIESACKQIITQRLKCSGAQWTVAGAVQTAKARAVWLSGNWPALCARRDALAWAI